MHANVAIPRTRAGHCPVTIGDLVIEPTASVGVVFAKPGIATNADELIAEADVAMYQSKRVGTGQAVVYSPEMCSSQPRS